MRLYRVRNDTITLIAERMHGMSIQTREKVWFQSG
jgi:hypothetical protein